MCLLGADRGRVLIDGRPAAQMTAGERARLLSYLPQGQDVHWPLSVERLVALGRLPHLAPFSRLDEADREAVHRALARSDERRVGKECVSTCRYRWSAYP